VARRLRRAVGLPDTEGLLIREEAEDSPAARASLAPGDLVVAAAGQPVRTVDDLPYLAVAPAPPRAVTFMASAHCS
jgi:serine protease Do